MNFSPRSSVDQENARLSSAPNSLPPRTPIPAARILLTACCLALAATAFAQSTVTWTGGTGASSNWSDGANWQGGIAPASGANVAFPNTPPYYLVTPDISPSVGSLTFTSSFHYFDSTEAAALTIGSGGLTMTSAYAYIYSSVSVVLGAPQSWSLGNHSSLYLWTSISGTPSNALAVTIDGGSRLTLADDNSFTGNVTLTGGGTLSLGNNNALGNAMVTVSGGGVIESYYTAVTVPNAISITGSTLQLGTTSAALSLSGPITLSSSPTFTVTGTHAAYFTGGLGETGGTRGITVSSVDLSADQSVVGPLVLQGTSSYTGTTTLMDNARLIFGTATALPVTNASIMTDSWLNSAYNVGNFAYGTYAGFGTAAVPASTFVDKFNKSNYSGAVGFDNGITVTDAIDLTGFNQFARLASLTTATISGPITPQGYTYNFGGGGGILTATSNLVDDGPNEHNRSVSVVSTNGCASPRPRPFRPAPFSRFQLIKWNGTLTSSTRPTSASTMTRTSPISSGEFRCRPTASSCWVTILRTLPAPSRPPLIFRWFPPSPPIWAPART